MARRKAKSHVRRFYRQGDIMLVEEMAIPGGLPEKDIVLARGEHSGHAHQFQEMAPVSVYVDPSTTTQHVLAEQEAILQHTGGLNTHEDFQVPAGAYEVRVERELDLVGEVRRVED